MGSLPSSSFRKSSRCMDQRSRSATIPKDHAFLPFGARGARQIDCEILPQTYTQSRSPSSLSFLLAFDLLLGSSPFGVCGRHQRLWQTTADLVRSKLLVISPVNFQCVISAHSIRSAGNSCGLNGNRCRPFDNANLAFRCPANCKAVHVLSPHAVGTQEVNYKPFVIGGPEEDELGRSGTEYIYRGDSFLCQAAIHAGVVSNGKGGCGVVKLVGEHNNFPSTKRNGIQSIAFDASFPKSFTFVSGLSSDCIKDLRWPLLAVTVIFTTFLSIFTASSAVFFPCVFTMLFLHVGLVSDPPTNSDYASLSSLIIGRFLPAAFVAAVFYRYSVKPQQADLHAYIERTVLWLGGAWVGSLNNYTFDFIPIQRLTPSDLRAQPGARLALVLVVLLIFSIAVGQIWYLRLEGRLPRYLGIYTIFVTFLIICVIVPTLNLRIHHYFLALLLLPGTRLQTRPSLLYQGILVGLFINGTARWGFDSILQTTAALRGDGQFNSLLPDITAAATTASNITLRWTNPPIERGYDGISVLVNDVERHRWYRGEGEP
ncbi:MAG: hypothetical protein Q9222_006992, partial [Ikaeria aurantiellina]